MRLNQLLLGPAPRRRDRDLLTDDHPLRPYPAANRWRTSAWLRLAVFAVTFFALSLLLTSAYTLAAGWSGLLLGGYGGTVITLVATITAYLVLTFALEGRVWPHELEPRRLAGLVRGLILGAAIMAVCVGLLALAGMYRVESVNWGYDPLPALISAGLGAGIAEELLFRGIGLRLIEEGLGSWGALAISGLVFGLVHLSNADATWWGAIAIALEAGLLIGAIYILTRSLWCCIGLHFAWNMTQGPVFGSAISGTGDADSWLVSTWTGPELLTGGTFGLEASIIPVVLAGSLGVVLLVIAQRRGLIVDPIWVRKRRLLAAAGATGGATAISSGPGLPSPTTESRTRPGDSPRVDGGA